MDGLARFVRTYRSEVLGISQEELARRSGLSWATIQEVEDAAVSRKRNRGTIAALARGLGVSEQAVLKAQLGVVSAQLDRRIVLDENWGVVGTELRVPLFAAGGSSGVRVPASLETGSPLLAFQVEDASMAPVLLGGDYVVCSQEADFRSGGIYFLELARAVGGQRFFRRVVVDGARLVLTSFLSGDSGLSVGRSDVVVFGRAVWLQRAL